MQDGHIPIFTHSQAESAHLTPISFPSVDDPIPAAPWARIARAIALDGRWRIRQVSLRGCLSVAWGLNTGSVTVVLAGLSIGVATGFVEPATVSQRIGGIAAGDDGKHNAQYGVSHLVLLSI